ncbi:MAG: endopeptidase La [Eubacteriaceae bacterium]|nr:endopeptidase La [Eubacteriaceae bacterium]
MLKQFLTDMTSKSKTESVNENELTVPIIPTSSMIIGPYTSNTMDMYRGKYLSAILSVSEDTRLVVMADRITDNDKDITLDDIRPIGTLCDIKGAMRYSRETTRVSIEGKSRVLIKEIVETEPYLMARVEMLDYSNREYTVEEFAMFSLLKDKFYNLMSIVGRLDDEKESGLDRKMPDDGADYISAMSPLDEEQFYSALECLDTKQRMKMLIEYIDMSLRTAQLEVELESKIASNFAEEQKHRYLREKKELIDRELNGSGDTISEYREKINALPIEQEYKDRLLKELDRLEGTPLGSQEASVTQSYFDCVLDLPWTKEPAGEFDIAEADAILEEDHYGLEKVKTRISEYLAVLKLTGTMKSPILCLVGPPGVGKTSIAKSVARATKRKFTRLSLGGMHDESEIRGHRKTYVGAMPGRIIAGLRQVGSTNTVFLLDEIDKLSKDYHGDPASALLEVLDPEQNSTFTDNYVEIPFDLSPVMFITTANSLSTIPAPLMDRLEIIQLDGYLPDEKLEIAKRHLLGKQLEANGITGDNIIISDDILSEIIENYTREAGVRQLERSIASLCRKAAKEVVAGREEPLEITSERLREYLGAQVGHYDTVEDTSYTGVVNGLAWTATGGTTLPLEAVIFKGKGKVQLTGQLGDVMKESASIAVGYLEANSERYGIDPKFWEENSIHVHAPEGAVPKDGPSAGVTMATVLLSAIRNLPVSQKLAMTGEITLTGRVLAIGGLREKLMAALRAGIDRVIIPKQNEKDLVDVPEKIRENLSISFAEKVDDVFSFVFGDLNAEG